MNPGLALLLVTALQVDPQAATAAARQPAPLLLQVRPGDSDVTFRIRKWTVLTVTGRFRDVSGEVLLDVSRPEASRVSIEVRVASLTTGEAVRDQNLQTEDFFDAARFPVLRFVSTSVARLPDGRASVSGDLTIRGVTQRVTVPVVLHGPNEEEGTGTLAGFETSFTLDRRTFGVLGSRWSGGKAIIGTDVNVRVVVAASKRRSQ